MRRSGALGGLPGLPVCCPEHIPAAGAARPSGSQGLQPEGAKRGENGHSPVELDAGWGEAGLRVRLRARNKALDGWIIVPTFQSHTMSSQVVLLRTLSDCGSRRGLGHHLAPGRDRTDLAGLAGGQK